MILDETYTLSNGVEIPKLGLGTWFIEDADAAQAVRDAIEVGYRNIDTAQAYGNERGVGEGVRTASVPREEIFVSTKLHAEIKSYDEAVAAINGSLETMGLDYIDLFLIHAPQPWADFRGGDYTDGNREAWRAMEEALEAGKVRAIGVSNFKNEDVDALVAGAKVVPHVNQVLVHAGNTPQDILTYSAEKNIQIQGYSPMGHGQILDNETIGALAEKYGVSVPQLAIRYVIQLGTVALPKTANKEHMKANADVNFEISAEDMDTLMNLEAKDYGDVAFFPVYSGK